MPTSLIAAIRNARMTALNTAIGANAQIKVYSGTVPANVGAALGGATLLATLTGNAAGYGTVSGPVLTVSAVAPDTNADASGTPTFVRVATSGGVDQLQADAGVGSGSYNFASALSAGQTVNFTAGSHTEGNP